jgi:hypothetical protein
MAIATSSSALVEMMCVFDIDVLAAAQDPNERKQ